MKNNELEKLVLKKRGEDGINNIEILLLLFNNVLFAFQRTSKTHVSAFS